MSENVERVKGKRFIKPIVYGNTATPFGYKRESDGHTHSWTVFVRAYHNEDPSHFIRKVQFKLHDSYHTPTRVIEQPPYEVTESGWGEFEVQIKIFFVDSNEKAVTAFHYLRLFAPILHLPSGGSQVVSEYYDEIIFNEPTTVMQRAIVAGDVKKCSPNRHMNNLSEVRQKCLAGVKEAQDELSREMQDLKDSLITAHRLLLKYTEDIDDSAPGTPQIVQ